MTKTHLQVTIVVVVVVVFSLRFFDPGGSINVAQSGPELSIILIASQLVGKKARGQRLFEVTQHSQAEKVEEKNHLSSYLCV